MPAPAAGAPLPAAEGEPRPSLDRQDAGGVRPVLEPPAVPIRRLDRRTAHRPAPGVGDQLVGASKHRDGVQLHGAEPVQHRGDPAAGLARAEQALGAQRDPTSLGRGQFEHVAAHLTPSTALPPPPAPPPAPPPRPPPRAAPPRAPRRCPTPRPPPLPHPAAPAAAPPRGPRRGPPPRPPPRPPAAAPRRVDIDVLVAPSSGDTAE